MMLCRPPRLRLGLGAIRSPYRRAAALALILGALSACGGSSTGSGQNYAVCGNGHLDEGEMCDDGNQSDQDACTAVCRPARCGDGAVETGMEQCDGLNLDNATCIRLGRGFGTLTCTAACEFDVSGCGPTFTPTIVRPTATVTPTRTPTATPLQVVCGNSLLEPGETCASCPPDCMAGACQPTSQTYTFDILLKTPAGQTATATTLLVPYRSTAISIPGSGSATEVRRRVRPAPPLPTGFTVDDLNWAVRLSASRAAGLASRLATAQFDACAGAPPPTTDDLTCIVETCAGSAGAIDDCSCTIEGPQP
jgi:cysteine-rich repeat protein